MNRKQYHREKRMIFSFSAQKSLPVSYSAEMCHSEVRTPKPACTICDDTTSPNEEPPSLLEVDTPPASPPDTLLNTKWNAPWSRSDTFDVLPTGSTHPATVPAKPLRRVTPGSGAADPPDCVRRESSSEGGRSSTFSLVSSGSSTDIELQYITPQDCSSEHDS